MSQAQTERLLSQLDKTCKERRRNLEACREFHVYMREGSELEEWIGEQMQTAASEDYGQDFEHLQVRKS